MSALPDSFRALVAEKQDDDVARGLRDLRADDLPDGDTVVRVDWSSVNYKDALAVSPKGRVAQISPLVPGVDLAGTVVEGEREGSDVIVHGHDLGVAHHGGFAEYARVPSEWVVPLPDGLSSRQAMALGTAGFPPRLAGPRAPGRRRGASPPACGCSGSRSTAWSRATGRCSCSAPRAGSARPRSASSPPVGSRS